MARPLLVEKQRAVPARALELGYRFAHPQLEGALRATLRG
jgi:NAD dependent epimerase/dehydratase family enzyme